MDLTAPEIRVLGCLVEKQRTTPDQYPLTLNALRSACNQATNRDPVFDYDDATVREAAQALGRHRLARTTSTHGSRVAKYRHLLDEALGLSDGELALLTVLMLRGPQTPGELRQRSERLHHFEGGAAVQAALADLADRGLVAGAGRAAGQKEDRFVHALGTGSEPAVQSTPSPEGSAPPARPAPPRGSMADEGVMEARLSQLEAELDAVKTDLAALREALGEG
ncbi:MAG: YceH family protein [Solirubrobacterales bacterium]